MTNQPVKISENCWKHTKENGDVVYRKTSDPESELHREDGPAVEYADGTKTWHYNGKLHRLDGPAIENVNVYKAWYINNKLHRTDGPAIEWSNGDKAWYYHGKFIDVKSQEEFEIYINNIIFF